jgi:hypothetical protein
MDKYNPDAKCIKCGGDKIFDRYADEYKPDEMSISFARFSGSKEPQYKPERIIRKCNNCEFIWLEAPLDSVTQEDTP